MSTKEIIRAWYTRLHFPAEFDAEFDHALSTYTVPEDATIENYDIKEEDGKKNLLSFLYFCEETARRYAALGIPEEMVMRQPFPGPGLAVRCMGELTKEKLDILRKADFVFRDEMAKAKLDKKAQQFFAIMTNVRTVGVKNNARTYGYVIAIRAVSTSQFVKAGVVELPFKFVTKVAEKIATTVKGVNRVVWDITPKPPATIEWE